jgi:hypothetical protein
MSGNMKRINVSFFIFYYFFYRKPKDGFIINAVKSTFYKLFKNTRIQRYKDTKIQGYKDTKIQGYKDTKIHVSFLFLGVHA